MADLEEPPMDSVEQAMKGLTKARKNAIVNAAPGYMDDSTLDGPGRRMLYAMIEDGFFEFRNDPRHPMLSIFLTDPLGLEVRARLLSSSGEG